MECLSPIWIIGRWLAIFLMIYIPWKSVVVNCTWPAIAGWYSMVWYAGTVPNLDNYRLKGLEEPKISIKIKITVKARLGWAVWIFLVFVTWFINITISLQLSLQPSTINQPDSTTTNYQPTQQTTIHSKYWCDVSGLTEARRDKWQGLNWVAI